MRINRYISSSGLCSRRGAEEYIKAGKVRVNGKTVTDLATEINEDNDTVTVDGKKVTPVTRFSYIMFHKPKGCVCTVKDDKDRKTVMDYLPEFENKRIYPIGRLDYDTEGLLLLTNDGDFANNLTQPSSEVPRMRCVTWVRCWPSLRWWPCSIVRQKRMPTWHADVERKPEKPSSR